MTYIFKNHSIVLIGGSKKGNSNIKSSKIHYFNLKTNQI